MIDPDAVFVQPMYSDAHGRPAIARMFMQLFTLFPDMTATPVRAAVSNETVFIESECAAALGRRRVTFEVCDRFVIRGGMIVHRPSYSDPSPVLRTLLAQPVAWPRAIRSRLPARP
jgi:limonene-1,2-epoxide hydrolase